MPFIIHHVEPCWNGSLNMMGTDFEILELKIANYIRRCHPKRVILTRFEYHEIDCVDYPNLIDLVDDVYNYGYGWEPEMFDDPNEYCEGGSHSKVVYIPDWIKQLKRQKVNLCGAFKGECLEDMQIALNHVGAKHKLIHSLSV